MTTRATETGISIPANAKITLTGSKKALKQKDGSILVPAKTAEEVGVQVAYLLVVE